VALVFFGLPVAVYLSLCLLPGGRRAAIGIGSAAVLLALLWLRTGAGPEDGFTRLLLAIAAAAVLLAALAQGLRPFLPPARLAWPGLVAGLALTAFAIFLSLL
jgi:hypothetical protein